MIISQVLPPVINYRMILDPTEECNPVRRDYELLSGIDLRDELPLLFVDRKHYAITHSMFYEHATVQVDIDIPRRVHAVSALSALQLRFRKPKDLYGNCIASLVQHLNVKIRLLSIENPHLLINSILLDVAAVFHGVGLKTCRVVVEIAQPDPGELTLYDDFRTVPDQDLLYVCQPLSAISAQLYGLSMFTINEEWMAEREDPVNQHETPKQQSPEDFKKQVRKFLIKGPSEVAALNIYRAELYAAIVVLMVFVGVTERKKLGKKLQLEWRRCHRLCQTYNDHEPVKKLFKNIDLFFGSEASFRKELCTAGDSKILNRWTPERKLAKARRQGRRALEALEDCETQVGQH
ncbi:MAG: hypothetical protein M1822_009572 [Bathelium mastoideum]|nr:MAG: hypothetical protein M1822_009572 [Bathelium mastoideum]